VKNSLGNQMLSVTYDYNQSIQGKNGSIALSISFSQAGAPSCVVSASKSIFIYAKASNNMPFMFYSQSQFQQQ
jgi:hypothetical protein